MVTLKETRSSISKSRVRRLRQAESVLKKAVDILRKKYHATRIVLIGSLAGKERFGFHSDIDICAAGLSDALYFKAGGDLLLISDDFDIDLIPIEGATPAMKKIIEKGKLLYENKG